ncbi:MAG: MTH1187 family thiamine-binding protein [Candidatus Thermoplasmatota archaeon]
MLAEFSVVPIGKGESVSQYVAECIRVVEASGLPYRLNPMGTVVEGDYDSVMAVVRECHMRVMGMASRVITTVKVDDRRGASGMIDRKVASVEEKVGKEVRK